MSGHGVAAEDDDDDEMAVSSQLEASAGVHDGTPSSVESTPEPDVPHEAAAEQPAQPQKRKGGRKPVSGVLLVSEGRIDQKLTALRSMRPLKSASSVIDKLKLPSESEGPSTSSNSKPLSRLMKRRLAASSKATGLQPTSA